MDPDQVLETLVFFGRTTAAAERRFFQLRSQRRGSESVVVQRFFVGGKDHFIFGKRKTIAKRISALFLEFVNNIQ